MDRRQGRSSPLPRRARGPLPGISSARTRLCWVGRWGTPSFRSDRVEGTSRGSSTALGPRIRRSRWSSPTPPRSGGRAVVVVASARSL